MEDTLAAKIVHAVFFVVICTVIVLLGWNEPLRYRFMSSQEIALLENPPPPPPPMPTPAWIDVHKTPSRLNEPSQIPPGGRTGSQSRSGRSY